MKTRELLLIPIVPIVLFICLYQLPYFGDWDFVYYHVGRTPLLPYQHTGFLNPPWAAWLLAPFSLLPQHLGGALMMTAALLVVVWAMHQMKAPLLSIVLCLLSPAALRYITSGQIGFVVLAGFVLVTVSNQPALGYLLMSVKPQVLGLAAVAHWVHSEAKGKTAVFFLSVLLLSFAVYGFWPLLIEPTELNQAVDFSPWPWGVLLGVPVAVWAVKDNRPTVAGLVTYLLVPYVSPSSLFIYAVVLFSIAPPWVSSCIFLFMWAFALLFT